MLASVIFSGASHLLSDDGHDRWTATNLLTYINQVRRIIVEKRPAEFREFRSVQLVSGTEQTAPSDTAVLLRVTRNMGSDGSTPGAGIFPVDGSSLDAIDQTWRNGTDSSIDEYVHMEGAKTYLVNPGVPATPDVYVEIELAAYLADLTDEAGTEDVGITDDYEMAMVYWLCHMAFGADTEAKSAEKSNSYYTKFMIEMGEGGDKSQ